MQPGVRGSRLSLGEQEWPIWGVTGALPLALPPISLVYHRLLLASGTLNPNADSIGIPIMGHLMAAMVIGPVVFAITWACLWRYDGGGVLFDWNRARPWKSAVATLVLGAPVVAIAGQVSSDVVAGQAWYEYLWDLYLCLWAAWFLLLHAALLAPGEAGSSDL